MEKEEEEQEEEEKEKEKEKETGDWSIIRTFILKKLCVLAEIENMNNDVCKF